MIKIDKTIKKKVNLKEKLNEDHLDLSLCSLETVPIKEIVKKILLLCIFLNKKNFFHQQFF